jgi:hypothetical protein
MNAVFVSNWISFQAVASSLSIDTSHSGGPAIKNAKKGTVFAVLNELGP